MDRCGKAAFSDQTVDGRPTEPGHAHHRRHAQEHGGLCLVPSQSVCWIGVAHTNSSDFTWGSDSRRDRAACTRWIYAKNCCRAAVLVAVSIVGAAGQVRRDASRRKMGCISSSTAVRGPTGEGDRPARKRSVVCGTRWSLPGRKHLKRWAARQWPLEANGRPSNCVTATVPQRKRCRGVVEI